MAPAKKRTKIASTAATKNTEEVTMQEFYSNEAMSGLRQILKRKVIMERGIVNKPPFASYIERHG
jgi:hypothetical protein